MVVFHARCSHDVRRTLTHDFDDNARHRRQDDRQLSRDRDWRSDCGREYLQDLFANIRDIVGGRSAAYEQELARARTIALEELQAAAQQLGAEAVVGVDLDYEVLGANNGMLMVSVSGTAVKFT